MNKSDIVEICVVVAYITMISVVFFVLFDETYFTPRIILTLIIMLALALVMRMSKFNAIGICAAAAYLATILVDIIYLDHDYVIINWIALTIPLIIGKGKSSTIGICGVLSYLAGIILTFFVFDKFWAIALEIALAFPFSMLSFELSSFVCDLMRILLIGDFMYVSLEFWLLSFAANIIWIYFLTRFFYWLIKAAISQRIDMDKDEPEGRNG